MSTNKEIREVEITTCNCCGKPIHMEDSENAYLVIHSAGEVVFEWWPKGDYCPSCLKKLVNGVIETLVVPDRYDRINEKAQIEIEKGLIKLGTPEQ